MVINRYTKLSIVIIPLLLGLAGAGIGVYASLNPDEFIKMLENIGIENIMTYLPIFIVATVLLVTVLAFLPIVNSFTSNSKAQAMLKERGTRKTAKILSVQDTGMSINYQPRVKITVETVPGSTATFDMTVPRIQVPRAGDMIEILFDPANPNIAISAL